MLPGSSAYKTSKSPLYLNMLYKLERKIIQKSCHSCTDSVHDWCHISTGP